MISIITRDELAHIMNGESTISRTLFMKFQFNITWITQKIIQFKSSLVVISYQLHQPFPVESLLYIPKWNNLYEEKLQTNFFAGSST